MHSAFRIASCTSKICQRDPDVMTRNVLFLIIGALAVGTAVLGYQFYQERQKTGIEISVGKGGISIEKK